MRQITIKEAKERQKELDLTPTSIYNMDKGRLELYQYENQEERNILLQKDWCYNSEQNKVFGLRVNGAKLTSKSQDEKEEKLKELKNKTHMKIYKKAERFLPHEAVKCGENFEKSTGKIVRYIGINALLGNFLLVKIDGQYYHFNENDHTLVGRW